MVPPETDRLRKCTGVKGNPTVCFAVLRTSEEGYTIWSILGRTNRKSKVNRFKGR